MRMCSQTLLGIRPGSDHGVCLAARHSSAEVLRLKEGGNTRCVLGLHRGHAGSRGSIIDDEDDDLERGGLGCLDLPGHSSTNLTPDSTAEKKRGKG